LQVVKNKSKSEVIKSETSSEIYNNNFHFMRVLG